MPVVTLPDGSQRTFDHPVTVDEVAGGIGPGLRKARNLEFEDAARLRDEIGRLKQLELGFPPPVTQT